MRRSGKIFGKMIWYESQHLSKADIPYPEVSVVNKGNNKITELRAILQRESQNSLLYKQTLARNDGYFAHLHI
jgi:hypothetical protein